MANNFPIPTKTVADLFLDEAGWTNDGSSWSNPPVTPQAAASFSAASPSATLNGTTSGIVRFFDQSDSIKVNEEIPGSGGKRGFRFRFGAKPSPDQNQNTEARYEILTPRTETWEYMKIWQPSNFFHRATLSANVTASVGDFSDWVEGDAVTTSKGQSAKFYHASDVGGGQVRLFFYDNSQGFVELMWDIGGTITNTRLSETVTVISRSNPAHNNKFSAQWVDDGGSGNGYENGSFTVNTSGTVIVNSFYPSGRLKPGLAAADFQPDAGELNNTIVSPPYDPILVFDVANNGSEVDCVIHRRRSSANNVADGGYSIYLNHGTTNGWEKVFENFGRQTYSTDGSNLFTHGFVLGASNSTFKEQTDFHLMDWELWTQKPTFLP